MHIRKLKNLWVDHYGELMLENVELNLGHYQPVKIEEASKKDQNDPRMKFYRYVARSGYWGGTYLHEDIWFLDKETKCGWWIVQNNWKGEIIARKWVSSSARKRFAYPTKEEALNSLYHRKKRQIQFLEHNMAVAKAVVRYFNEKNKENQPVSKFKMPSSSE